MHRIRMDVTEEEQEIIHMIRKLAAHTGTLRLAMSSL